ncbi:MAG: hypothetical protein J3K34DRAFT_519609 [Monoraphidium minutum]|nr:MAG: hypothetical protein J3K34DRAFT_519609 [Monoraphidium minutum]
MSSQRPALASKAADVVAVDGDCDWNEQDVMDDTEFFATGFESDEAEEDGAELAGSSFTMSDTTALNMSSFLDELQDTAGASRRGGGAASGGGCGAWDQHAASFAPGAPSMRIPSATQMASSVPIAIPRWPRPAFGAAPGAAAAAPASLSAAPARAPAAPFVPPHRMTCGQDFGLTAEGGSPSACLKREKLRARNAILRSTGFL